MKILFTGAQSTGKSSLLKALKKEEFLPNDYIFISEIVRNVFFKNLPINESSTQETQLIIFNKHLENLLLFDNFVTDRGLVDAFSFTSWLYQKGKVDQDFSKYQYILFLKYFSLYDLIFYFPVNNEVSLEKDGVRSENLSFREEIDSNIRYYLNLPIFKNKYVTMEGSVSNRLEVFKKCFNLKINLNKYEE